MEISRVDLWEILGGAYEATLGSSSLSLPEDDSDFPSSQCAEVLDISARGKFRNAVSQMSDAEKEEMKVFHQQMMEAVRNGTFDASQMAANAPEALKSFARENGIDLETMLKDQASMMERIREGMGPVPPMPLGVLGNALSQMSDEEKEEIRDFHKQMMEAVKNGTFDASQMAANAPEALKSIAEKNGIDLETMLKDQASMLEDRVKNQGAPPPPPPILYGRDGYGQTYSEQDLSMDFLTRWLQGEDVEESSLSVADES